MRAGCYSRCRNDEGGLQHLEAEAGTVLPCYSYSTLYVAPCNKCVFRYKYGEWQACSATCDTGDNNPSQKRSVSCVGPEGDVVANVYCPREVEDTKSCEAGLPSCPLCEFGDWTTCSATYFSMPKPPDSLNPSKLITSLRASKLRRGPTKTP